jgi:hypothetical protein
LAQGRSTRENLSKLINKLDITMDDEADTKGDQDTDMLVEMQDLVMMYESLELKNEFI